MSKSVKGYIIYVILLITIVSLMLVGGFVHMCSADSNLEQKSIVIKEESVQENNYVVVSITLNQRDIELIAKTVYGEARGCSVVEQSAVIWCILNRVDAGWGTIEDVVTAPYQFTGYKESNPIQGDFVELAIDVLLRWQAEKYCIGEVGRTLPDNYLYFHGDGKQNIFRDKYSGDYNTWGWQAINPYP